VTASRDEQITAVRFCCADKLISNGQQPIKRNILTQCKVTNYLQMTQPFFTRRSGDHMRRKMVTDSWYSTNNWLTVGDVHRMLTLCKQKHTSALSRRVV